MSSKRTMGRILVILLVIALSMMVLAACGGDEDDDGDGGDNVQNAAVTIALNWTDDNEWSGLYMADDQGYFADEKLDVTVQLVSDDEGNWIDPITEVAEGRAQFGVADSADLLHARANGLPLVGVTVIYQQHPLVLTSLAEKNITRPEDLVGKTVHISGVTDVLFRAFLGSQGIDPADVNIVERTDYTSAPLLSGEADVIDAWVTNETVHLSLEGVDYNIIIPADFGIEIYPAVIFTSEDMIANQPDVVQRFANAFLKGQNAAFEDPAKAVDLTVARDDSLSSEVQNEGMQRSLPLIKPAGKEVGMMEAEVWAFTHEMLLEQGIISEPLAIEDAYNLDFVRAYYE